MGKDLQKLLDSLNERSDKKTEETDPAELASVRLMGSLLKTHAKMYGTASACAAIATLVSVGFHMALDHSHKKNDD